ncbi:MAG: MarR family EPS-associated transcriptional regulator [Desulfobacteraceae bacterium]|nr:MarR family EPS-associated transcriptional regulator [Desulfobacteraceae bacterium]
MQESIKYKILKNIADNPKITQRQLARELDVSLGKANYCLRALIAKGLVKAENFRQSPHKIQYLYKLTPGGLEEKARVTSSFLKQKLREYEEIKAEIEELRKESGQ